MFIALKLLTNNEQLINMDSFKKFIETNSEAFDTEMPPLAVWKNIERRLPTVQKKIKRTFSFLRIAAAVALLIIGAGLGIFLNNTLVSKNSEVAVDAVAPDFEEAKKFYTTKINQSITQLVSYNGDSTVLNDVQEVDSFQNELFNELRNAPESSREEIVKRIIHSYQIKLGILDHVLERVQNNAMRAAESKKVNNHEGI